MLGAMHGMVHARTPPGDILLVHSSASLPRCAVACHISSPLKTSAPLAQDNPSASLLPTRVASVGKGLGKGPALISAALLRNESPKFKPKRMSGRSGGFSLEDTWCRNVWHDMHSWRRPCSFRQQSFQPVTSASLSPLRASPLANPGSTWRALVNCSLITKQYIDSLHPGIHLSVGLLLTIFTIWGLGPSLKYLRSIIKGVGDGEGDTRRGASRISKRSWEESGTRRVMAFYVRPALLWLCALLACRGLNPVVLAMTGDQQTTALVQQYVMKAVHILVFAFITARGVKQVSQWSMERRDGSGAEETRNAGTQFVGNFLYSLVWGISTLLFMEGLGVRTQKWITAGGFGGVLLTLAGRELLTNFLSSIMIHAARPFMVNEWIVTKIDGQEVSGTVEHVGWWEPTLIRGDDREAVHIPNHKFSVSVIRNLSQKTHWRIKTYIGISHLDVDKVQEIVATMRKVITKHPQLEQKHLHRRVFLESINPDSQALMIQVSTFVKTSHFEEYLRVKEVVLLDLLKVVTYHEARLATPIRSYMRMTDDHERSSPYRNGAQRVHLVLAEAANGSSSSNNSSRGDVHDAETTIMAAATFNDRPDTPEQQHQQGGGGKVPPVSDGTQVVVGSEEVPATVGKSSGEASENGASSSSVSLPLAAVPQSSPHPPPSPPSTPTPTPTLTPSPTPTPTPTVAVTAPHAASLDHDHHRPSPDILAEVNGAGVGSGGATSSSDDTGIGNGRSSSKRSVGGAAHKQQPQVRLEGSAEMVLMDSGADDDNESAARSSSNDYVTRVEEDFWSNDCSASALSSGAGVDEAGFDTCSAEEQVVAATTTSSSSNSDEGEMPHSRRARKVPPAHEGDGEGADKFPLGIPFDASSTHTFRLDSDLGAREKELAISGSRPGGNSNGGGSRENILQTSIPPHLLTEARD
eukprot:jgi/Mesen1/10462/ME000082S09970